MAKNKTTENENSVTDYLKNIKEESKRKDCTALIALTTKETGLEAKMWGPSIVGFGSYHYIYESGHEGDAPLFGLSSRANAIVLYLHMDDEQKELLKKLGKHKTGKVCLYIQKVEHVDTGILTKMIKYSIKYISKKYPTK